MLPAGSVRRLTAAGGPAQALVAMAAGGRAVLPDGQERIPLPWSDAPARRRRATRRPPPSEPAALAGLPTVDRALDDILANPVLRGWTKA